MKKITKRSSLETPGDRLKYLRALLQVSRAYLQEKYGLPEVTLKSWENNKVGLSSAAVKRCVEIYKAEELIVDENWILLGTGLDPVSKVTIAKLFAEPSKMTHTPNDENECILTEANTFKNSNENAVVFLVSDDEMRPFYKRGDYVGGKLYHGQNLKNAINKDCIVYLKDGSRFLRRLIQNSNDGFNLSCINPTEISTTPPVMFNVEIEGAAPVIWHRWREE